MQPQSLTGIANYYYLLYNCRKEGTQIENTIELNSKHQIDMINL